MATDFNRVIPTHSLTISKHCAHCGLEFFKRIKDTKEKWESKKYCSARCANIHNAHRSPIFERFLEKVIKKEGCWGWNGAKDGNGYGIISRGRGLSPAKSNRISYEYFKGIIPPGMVVRHKCDNPECANPDHLELGTQKDNARDMVERGRMNPKSLLNLKSRQLKRAS